MSVWKQILICCLVLAVAVVGWARFFPGAGDVLERWGVDWALAATKDPAAAGNEGAGRQGRGGGGFGGSPLVVTAPVTFSTINDRLAAIGTGQALSSVIVNPFASGRLVEIPVRSGSVVEAGTVLARLDSEAEEIAVDRARIALDDAEARLERVMALRSSNTVTAVQQTEAELAVGNARLQLREAELALDRRSIVAPISGIVGILPVSVGNYVTAQTEIATIDDRSEILVDFWVPERFATAIEIGAELTATPVARRDETFKGVVSSIDNRVDPESRTLRVQGRIDNPDDALRAGMSFQVEMRFPGDTYPAVDPLAVQWSAEGAYIWSVTDGRAARVPVRIIQRNTDSVLVEAEIAEGQQVVTEGVHAVREGGEVQIARQNDQPAATTTGTTPARGS